MLLLINMWGFIKSMWIYVNLCEFMGNKWCFNNKNVFTTIHVVWVTTGDGLKSQNGQFKISEYINFGAHKK